MSSLQEVLGHGSSNGGANLQSTPYGTISMIPKSTIQYNRSNTATRELQSVFNPAIETSGISLCSLEQPHLQCQNGGLCHMGNTDLSKFNDYGSKVPMNIRLYQSPTFDATQFLNLFETMHCECPMGYTGFFCEIMVDECEIESPKYCFHGGLCDENESGEYGCNCSPNGSLVGVGDSCENQVTSRCPMQFMEQTDNYCTNNGICNQPQKDVSVAMCDCPPGFSGTHCEMVAEVRYPFSSNTDLDSSSLFETNCPVTHTLECENGGSCQLGPTDYGIFQPDLPHSLSQPSVNGMHCDCSGEYTGPLCDTKVEICGETDDYACFNGGVCTPYDPSDPNGYECVCQGSHMQFHTPAAGKACQYLLTKSCVVDDPFPRTSFCTNGGECKEIVGGDDFHKGCHCPLEFTGRNCEYPMGSKEATEYDQLQQSPPPPLGPSDTTTTTTTSSTSALPFGFTEHEIPECPTPGHHRLVCGRYGKCRVGDQPDDIYASLNPSTMEWLNEHLAEDDTSTMGGMYCQCAAGYVGTYCDLKLAVCGEGEHICLRGSVCVENGLTEQEEKYACACERAGERPTVGHMCEFIAETSCTLEDEFSDHSFCTNGGTCRDIVGRYQNHAGCDCPPGYKGDHCEIVEGLQFDEEPKPEISKPVPVNIVDPTEEDEEIVFSETFHAEEERVPTTEQCPTPGKHKLICGRFGKCKVGEKPKDLYAGLDPATMTWLNQHLAKDNTDEDGGMYCQCAEGYVGNYCELQLAVCGEGEHICFSGGVCTENGLTEKDEKYSCSCKHVGQVPTVGHMCEFIAETSCSLEEEFSKESFCTNGGTCKDIVGEYMNHAGCNCRPGFKGQHCEIVEGLQFDKMIGTTPQTEEEEFPVDVDTASPINEDTEYSIEEKIDDVEPLAIPEETEEAPVEESEEEEVIDPGPPSMSEELETTDDADFEPIAPDAPPAAESESESPSSTSQSVQDDDFEFNRPTKDPTKENQQPSKQAAGNKQNPFVERESKAIHIVGLVFAVIALVLIPIFIFVSRRSFSNEAKKNKSRKPIDMNLDADGGTMKSVSVDESTSDGSSGSGQESTQEEDDQAIV